MYIAVRVPAWRARSDEKGGASTRARAMVGRNHSARTHTHTHTSDVGSVVLHALSTGRLRRDSEGGVQDCTPRFARFRVVAVRQNNTTTNTYHYYYYYYYYCYY